MEIPYSGVPQKLLRIFFCFKNLDPPGKTTILLLFARAAAIFGLLEVESSSSMNWKANAKPEDALASNFLPGVNLGFWRAPQHEYTPLKSFKMTTNSIWLELVLILASGRALGFGSVPHSHFILGFGGNPLFGMECLWPSGLPRKVHPFF